MSTLEKTIGLLETLPDNKIETVYAFVRFINSDTYEPPSESMSKKMEDIQSMLGTAHAYANPALIEQEEEIKLNITIPGNILKYIFKNIYFINGTAYAGKSTMVKLLAKKHDGICCGENYHAALMNAIDAKNQPNLSYFDTMKDWQEFINRTPEEYDRWILGCSNEASGLEIILLIQLAERGKKIFVDTNISTETLKEISDYHHVAIMLAPQSTSMERFFDREDNEKQFILEQIHKAADPEKTMQNYKECLAKVNSMEKYHAFEKSGFFTLARNDERTPEQTLEILEKHFNLMKTA